jgi:hypothetical protein
MNDRPIACDLTAIPSEQRGRHEALATLMFGAVEQKRELADGYAYQLPVDLWEQVAEWVMLERLCCPFLNFGLELRQDGEFWLTLSGSPGAKEILQAGVALEDGE